MLPAPPPPDRRRQAVRQAIARAAAALGTVHDWPARCARLGLPAPAADHAMRLPFLGAMLRVRPPDFASARDEHGAAAADAAWLLALHFLQYAGDVTRTGAWISFRDFSGGAFYWGPFRGRVIQPLLGRFGNRLDLLGAALAAHGIAAVAASPELLQARVPAVGPLELFLLYRAGDAEFGPTADVLFDAAFRRVFGAEDAAALAGLFTASLHLRARSHGASHPRAASV